MPTDSIEPNEPSQPESGENQDTQPHTGSGTPKDPTVRTSKIDLTTTPETPKK